MVTQKDVVGLLTQFSLDTSIIGKKTPDANMKEAELRVAINRDFEDYQTLLGKPPETEMPEGVALPYEALKTAYGKIKEKRDLELQGII